MRKSKFDKAIIIRKKKFNNHNQFHGGSWKLAYADFVTALMAFFLLLWLLSASPSKKLETIAQYFVPTLSFLKNDVKSKDNDYQYNSKIGIQYGAERVGNVVDIQQDGEKINVDEMNNKIFLKIETDINSMLENSQYINNRDLLMNIPMETYNYFFKDNGPYSLICKLGVDNNLKRLDYVISKSNNFNGYYAEMYESFTDDIRDLKFLLEKINKTHKYILYNDPKEIKSFRDMAVKLGMKDKVLKADSIINQKISDIELRKKLDDLKLIASAKGHAIFIINANIHHIDVLEKWIKTVAKSLEYNIMTISELRDKIAEGGVEK